MDSYWVERGLIFTLVSFQSLVCSYKYRIDTNERFKKFDTNFKNVI